MLRRLSEPRLAVSVERAQERLRIDFEDDDNDLERLLLGAQGVVEKRTGLVLSQSDWEYRCDYWPCRHLLQIPLAPVRDITAIKYVDKDQIVQTVDEANYSWIRTVAGADIVFSRNYSLPTLFCALGVVRVEFSAGFDDPLESGSGDDPELVLPAQAELGVLFLVATWDAYRESVSADSVAAVPHTLDLLLEGIKVFR